MQKKTSLETATEGSILEDPILELESFCRTVLLLKIQYFG